MKRRLLAMVLSLAMLMGLLPTAALAAGSGGLLAVPRIRIWARERKGRCLRRSLSSTRMA